MLNKFILLRLLINFYILNTVCSVNQVLGLPYAQMHSV